MPKAFVCYARDDKKFVDEGVMPILDALGVDIWMDTEDLHGAERWKEVIQRAMPECDYFLLVVTWKAAASPAVRGEVEWILKNRPELLIPIRAGEVRRKTPRQAPSAPGKACVRANRGKHGTGYVRGDIDYRDNTRDGRPSVDWSWDGNDEMDPASGRGWAVIDGDKIRGVIALHHGDESEFEAIRKDPPRPKSNKPKP